MTLGGKVATVATTLGTIGGGVALTNHLITPSKPKGKTIRERLTSEGFDINVTNWTSILNAHNTLQNTDHTFKSTNNEQTTDDQLKQRCTLALSKLANDVQNYRKTRQWCVVEITIQKVLENAKYTVLNAAQDKAGEGPKWEKKTQDLRDAPDSFPDVGNKMTGTKETDIPILKKACADLRISELKTTATDFNNKFELAKFWCSIKEGNV